ncbi:MAG: asparagine synthetase B family protein, partial [Chitinophagales bacterium]
EQQLSINNYDAAKDRLFELLNDAVRLRLISDVPLGAFLSGGIDSSIVCGLASRHTQQLKTFSIGYSEHEFFDETKYARLVSKHFNTEHTVFSLSRNDLHASLFDALNYFDEPFGDSSALPVHILSQHTRKHVKVALSGDGADELFGGYLKHLAEFRARNQRLPELSAAFLSPLWKMVPKSRNTSWTNLARKAQRYVEGIKLSTRDRYWQWCSLADEKQAADLLLFSPDEKKYKQRKEELTQFIGSRKDLNDVLLNDVSLVLPDDMLMKVDYMSMANSLEVRTPFLDYRVAEFAFSIPAAFKVDRHRRKKIVYDAFKDFLPSELRNRRKQGFEIPLHSFLTTELSPLIENYFSDSFIFDQKIFDVSAIRNLKEQLHSSNPNDSASRMWGLLVFQHWWKQWMT